ncbi:MAG: TIGR02281 family clan AA aspartic protease [Sphingomonadaceae bacterium]
MVTRFAIFGILVIGVVVAIAPDLERNTAPETETVSAKMTAPAISTKLDSSRHHTLMQSNRSGSETLQRAANGHFFADASVGNSTIRFMVDTGASVVALTGEDARSAGLTWDASDIRPIGAGASGTVYGVPTRISQITIGSIRQENIDAVIIPEGLPISLLGQSFLNHLVNVTISGDSLELEDRKYHTAMMLTHQQSETV